jgi:phospholipid N-methyltransferase
MRRQLGFLKESIKNMRMTGSIAPSSRFLCRNIVSKIDPDTASVVVELGPGDGVITKYLLRRLRPEARLLVFEINEVFVENLRTNIQDPRMILIHDSAENMAQHLHALGIDSVDYVVSGIPFVLLPASLSENITRHCKELLRPGGRFIQFHYSKRLVPFYKRVFGNVKVNFIPLNIPPAIVVTCNA